MKNAVIQTTPYRRNQTCTARLLRVLILALNPEAFQGGGTSVALSGLPGGGSQLPLPDE
jgi:hypothetical protein